MHAADPDNWFGPSIQGGMDCEDGDNLIYPTAPELCDGIINDCGNTLPMEEQDGDGDGFVQCSFDEKGWIGDATIQDNDCNNNDASIYPDKPELFRDGLINACGNTLPENEQDLDQDNYAECTFDKATANGALTIIGDGDYDDNVNTTYPSAPELCDGRVNACGNPLL